MKNPLVELIKLFETLINGADEKLLDVLHGNQKDYVYVAAPDVVITLLRTALMVRNHIEMDCIESKKINLINPANVIPSFDWAITLYHKDYPLDKHSWMIRKMALNTPLKFRQDHVEKHVLYISELINTSIGKVELN